MNFDPDNILDNLLWFLERSATTSEGETEPTQEWWRTGSELGWGGWADSSGSRHSRRIRSRETREAGVDVRTGSEREDRREVPRNPTTSGRACHHTGTMQRRRRNTSQSVSSVSDCLLHVLTWVHLRDVMLHISGVSRHVGLMWVGWMSSLKFSSTTKKSWKLRASRFKSFLTTLPLTFTTE